MSSVVYCCTVGGVSSSSAGAPSGSTAGTLSGAACVSCVVCATVCATSVCVPFVGTAVASTAATSGAGGTSDAVVECHAIFSWIASLASCHVSFAFSMAVSLADSSLSPIVPANSFHSAIIFLVSTPISSTAFFVKSAALVLRELAVVAGSLLIRVSPAFSTSVPVLANSHFTVSNIHIVRDSRR
jgi:hypothetical protein